MMRGNLGDSWAGTELNQPDPNAGVLSVDYWRAKAGEFQTMMNAIDSVAQDSWALASVLPEGYERDEILAGVGEFNSRRSALKLAAEGINMAAATINAAGGRFPVLSIPSTLGLPPLALPAAALAAFAAAATLIDWGKLWTAGQRARLEGAYQAAQSIEDPTLRDQTLATLAGGIQRTDEAIAAMDSPLGSIAGIVKWLAIGALAFVGYKALAPRLRAS